MPAKYEKLGISFQYPENWTLDEEDALAGRAAVTVYSPGGAFWSVAILPKSAYPEELAQAAAEALKQEYEGAEVEKAQQSLVGYDLVGYDLNFFYLDLTNTAQIRSLRVDPQCYTIIWQAEDRELVGIERVFLAMTVSLLSNLRSLGDAG